jgi:hypothetical protein
MSTPLPPDEEARAALDRHIKRTVAGNALRKISDIASELEKEDRRSSRIFIVALVVLAVVAVCSGIAVYLASERYKARTPVSDAAPTALVADGRHTPIA